MADLALLERLCCARGISGCEEEIREIILEEIRPYADCVEVTPLGNLLAFKKGANRAKTKLMLNAHMDEVGMTVTYIEDNGLLRFATVGGIDRRVLCGKPVTVGKGIPGAVSYTHLDVYKRQGQHRNGLRSAHSNRRLPLCRPA